ncbi:MAG: hypothetical protein PHN31_00720 [Candidatus Gracilibacteria bacterium]|nr:hypothetical protein [Candidatus Gracilibacteria bacterium]
MVNETNRNRPTEGQNIESQQRQIEAESITSRSKLLQDNLLNEYRIKELPKTPENMREAFKIAEDINGVKRYLLISAILNNFIYSNNLHIEGTKTKWWIITNENMNLVGANTEEYKEFQDVIDDELEYDDYRNVVLFQQIMREGNIENKANQISKKVGIKLVFNNSTEKQQLLSQIDSDSRLRLDEKIILTAYVDGGYEQIQTETGEYITQTEQNLRDNQRELRRLAPHIDLTDQKQLSNYARNPDQLIGDVTRSLAQNPLTLFSTLGLIIGKIFGFDTFDTKDASGKVTKKGSWFMKLFAFGTGVGLYKTFGVGEFVGDAIDGEYNETIGDAASATGEALKKAFNWSRELLKSTYGGLKGISNDLINRVSNWHNYRNLNIYKSGKIIKLMDMNFADLYLISQKNDLKNQLINKKNKKIDDNDVIEKLTEKLEDLLTRGLKAFNNDEKLFFDTIKSGNLNITQVEKLIYDKEQENIKNSSTSSTESEKDSQEKSDKKQEESKRKNKKNKPRKSKDTSDDSEKIDIDNIENIYQEGLKSQSELLKSISIDDKKDILRMYDIELKGNKFNGNMSDFLNKYGSDENKINGMLIYLTEITLNYIYSYWFSNDRHSEDEDRYYETALIGDNFLDELIIWAKVQDLFQRGVSIFGSEKEYFKAKKGKTIEEVETMITQKEGGNTYKNEIYNKLVEIKNKSITRQPGQEQPKQDNPTPTQPKQEQPKQDNPTPTQPKQEEPKNDNSETTPQNGDEEARRKLEEARRKIRKPK